MRKSSGPPPADAAAAAAAAPFFQILALVSAYFSSDRDYRLVLPDACEMLLKNLGADAILLFLRPDDGGDELRLEFAESLDRLDLAPYSVGPGEGLTGRLAAWEDLFVTTGLPASELGVEAALNPFLAGRPLAAFRLHGPRTAAGETADGGGCLGVLYFLFHGAPPAAPVAVFLRLVADLVDGYLSAGRARRELHRVQKKFQLLSGLTHSFAGTLEIRPVLSVFMNVAASALAAEVGVLVIFQEGGTQPEMEVNWGVSRHDLEAYADGGGRSLFAAALAADGPLALRRLDEAGFVRRTAGGGGRQAAMRGVLAGSLAGADGPLGILVFANKRSRGVAASFDELDADLFGVLLEQLRSAVENWRLYRRIVAVKTFNDKVLESMDDGLLTVDLDGRVHTANRRAQRLCAVPAPLVGLKLAELFPLPVFADDVFLPAIRRGTLAEDVPELELERGGASLVLGFAISPLRGEQGETVGAVILVDDRTERHALQRSFARAERLAALGELSAGIAHEIKNPLTSMKGFAQLLPARLGDRAFLETFARVMTGEIMRLDDLIERLLTFARPPVRELSLVSLADVLADALALARFQIEQAGLEARTDIEEDLPPVNASRGGLMQVFLNVLINAVQASPRGGLVTLRAWREPFRRRGGLPVPGVRVEIADNGGGIAAEDIGRVFNPFYTTKEGGTGLGLPISFRIVEELGGALELRSTPGAGTTVSVALPLAEETHG